MLVQGRIPETLLILQVHGLPWAARHRFQLPGSCVVDLCACQRPELASQSLSNFVNTVKKSTKRKHNEGTLDKEASLVDQQATRPLEWYLATPRQMRVAGYPGFAVGDRDTCLRQEGNERNEAAVSAPAGFMDSSDFPCEIIKICWELSIFVYVCLYPTLSCGNTFLP